jgi:hypothetical protein
VLHGGRRALLAAADPQSLRAANAYSLLETSGSSGWRLALGLERALAARVALLGVSLTLNTTALGGVLHGYPHDRETVDRIANFPLRGCSGSFPGPCAAGAPPPAERAVGRRRVRGPPVGRARRGAAARRRVEGDELEERLDVICIGVPHTTADAPP